MKRDTPFGGVRRTNDSYGQVGVVCPGYGRNSSIWTGLGRFEPPKHVLPNIRRRQWNQLVVLD